MAPANPPEITLELTGGSLTIRTAEVIYRILVATGAGGAAPALPQATAAPAQAALLAPDDDWGDVAVEAPASAVEGDEDYYRDLSNDMYREVGRMARRLSMSIRDVKIDKQQSVNLEEAGVRLEEAKDELESVVKMTEHATMKIMDLGEEIQKAIDQAQSILELMSTPPEDTGNLGQSFEERRAQLEQAMNQVAEYLGQAEAEPDPLAPLLEEAMGLLSRLKAAPAREAPTPPAPVEPASPAGPRFLFPVDLVFQTVYELCTNETVKKHLKAMWEAGAQAFDSAKVEEGLNALAPAAPDEDNFLVLDLKGVLKALFQASNQDRFQQVLKKMAGTVDQIFLEQTLPLEAMPAPAAAAAPAPAAPAPASAPAPNGGADPEALARLEALLAEMGAMAVRPALPPLPTDMPEMLRGVLEAQLASASLNVVDAKLRSQLESTMAVVFGSVNNIIEALSFQDLSGQAIYRIVRLLTDFQVQLLAMVVSFGSKLKAKAVAKEITTEQSEKMAQAEVDKVLGNLGVHETEAPAPGVVEEPTKLDQGAVNDMLANMGF